MTTPSRTSPEPIDGLIAINYRCNTRCVMCNIWEGKNDADFPVEMLEKIPATLKFLNISGGEPFLSRNIVDIVERSRKRFPRAAITISTNGIAHQAILKQAPALREIDPDIGLGISIDGIGEMHDRIRGVPGAFERCMKTLDGLLAAGFRNLRLAFTAAGANDSHYREVYDLAREKGVQFTSAVAHDSGHYFQTDTNGALDHAGIQEEIEYIVSSELKTMDPKRWFRAFFHMGLAQFVSRNPRPIQCGALSDFFFVDPKGNLYPCNILDEPVGNLNTSSWEDLWSSTRAQDLRKQIETCPKQCWMVCTARTSILKHPVQSAAWVARNKVKAHLGLEVLGACSGTPEKRG